MGRSFVRQICQFSFYWAEIALSWAASLENRLGRSLFDCDLILENLSGLTDRDWKKNKFFVCQINQGSDSALSMSPNLQVPPALTGFF